MKLIGVVARVYYNKDNQKIFQINESIRKAFSIYKDIVLISILPTNNNYYTDIKPGEDKLTAQDKEKLNYILDKCDAVIVPGGTNWYNFDEYIINYTIEKDKPLLCICLGFQSLSSIYSKNRDKFDMTTKINNKKHYGPPNQYQHINKILKCTKLYKILNKEKIPVNSLHNSQINPPLKDLIISSISEDGVIEAVELPNKKFVIGLEWHPEYLLDANSLSIFDAFINSI